MSALLIIPLGVALYYQPYYHREPEFYHYYGRVTCYVFTVLMIFLAVALISFVVLKRRSFGR
jgi:hypothetical protein